MEDKCYTKGYLWVAGLNQQQDGFGRRQKKRLKAWKKLFHHMFQQQQA